MVVVVTLVVAACLHGHFKVMNFNEFSIASVDVF